MEEHDEVSAAFARYRVSAAQGFGAAETETVFQTVRARRTRRTAVAASVVLLAVGGLVTNGLTAAGPPQIAPPFVSLSPSEPAASSSPAPTQTSLTDPGRPHPGTRTDLANQVRFLNQAMVARIRGGTLILPPWPTGSPLCPAGTFTFTDGKVLTGTADPAGRPFEYLVLFKPPLGIHANLDGRPGDEMVIPVACGFTEVNRQLLVVTEKEGKFQGIGYMPALPAFDRFYPYDGGLVVEVINEMFYEVAEQRRRYTWNGLRFVHTHGPAAFPAVLQPDVRDVDLRNSYFKLMSSSGEATPCDGWLLSFVDGWSGNWEPATTFELGEISLGGLAEPEPTPSGRGVALVTVVCRSPSTAPVTWVLKVVNAEAVGLLRTGIDGVTAIISHRIVDGFAEVTVRTEAGQEIRRLPLA